MGEDTDMGIVRHVHSHTGDGRIHDEFGSLSFACRDCRSVGQTFELRMHGTRSATLRKLVRQHQQDRHGLAVSANA